jgi:hypothetical protein
VNSLRFEVLLAENYIFLNIDFKKLDGTKAMLGMLCISRSDIIKWKVVFKGSKHHTDLAREQWMIWYICDASNVIDFLANMSMVYMKQNTF